MGALIPHAHAVKGLLHFSVTMAVYNGPQEKFGRSRMTTALYNTPPYIAPQLFSDADAALAQVQGHLPPVGEHLRQALAHFVATGDLPQNVRAFYPQVRIHTGMATHVPRGEALHTYGLCRAPASTRPH